MTSPQGHEAVERLSVKVSRAEPRGQEYVQAGTDDLRSTLNRLKAAEIELKTAREASVILVGDEAATATYATLRSRAETAEARVAELEGALKRNRAALDLIDPARPLQYATTMDLMRKDMDAAILPTDGAAGQALENDNG